MRLGPPENKENDVVVEHAELTVEAGREAEFRKVFGRAREVPAEADGLHRGGLPHRAERPGTFLLRGGESVEARTVGFRRPERSSRRRALVGPFFAAPPLVEHHRELGARSGPDGPAPD